MKTIRKKVSKKKKRYPFIIHAEPNGGYPSHTHGLTKVGMPELMIDPLAFYPTGNSPRIIRTGHSQRP